MRNQLEGETSPYLRQHADNPVHWYPWGPEALSRARDEDKPILLSIGYSACHWCHVMAHESFEDPDTAERMNRDFVNVKVDREERPDLDRIYQLAHQVLSRRAGGWPLTVFLDPHDQSPFFAGTYFPPRPRHGLPSFAQLLEHISRAWSEQREAIGRQNAEFKQVLQQLESNPATADDRHQGPLSEALETLRDQFDGAHGGFGAAPKFPHPAHLVFLQRQRHLAARHDAGHMLPETLRAMARGGIHDQLGGGFFRYCVDREWAIPHFEKMLYDNGQLLSLYAWAGHAEPDGTMARVCDHMVEWLGREMRHEDGPFFASLDADSDGGEGAFYVWSRESFTEVLGDEASLARSRFGLDRPANFEGQWHLYLDRSVEDLAKERDASSEAIAERLEQSRKALLGAREARARPGRDDKIIAAWNAMMITGLADCGRLLDRPEATEKASRALDFIRREMVRDDRLHAVWAGDRARFPAYLDDHAQLITACLALLQAQWRDQTLEFALWLAEQLLTRFEDRDNGGFFFTAHDHESLLMRPKPFADDATPNGNASACLGLLALGHLTGHVTFIEAAERSVNAAWRQIQSAPVGHLGMLNAMHALEHPDSILIINCDVQDRQRWTRELARRAQPERWDFVIPDDASSGDRQSTVINLPARQAAGFAAQLCRGTHCETPIDDAEELWRRLQSEDAEGVPTK